MLGMKYGLTGTGIGNLTRTREHEEVTKTRLLLLTPSYIGNYNTKPIVAPRQLERNKNQLPNEMKYKNIAMRRSGRSENYVSSRIILFEFVPNELLALEVPCRYPA